MATHRRHTGALGAAVANSRSSLPPLGAFIALVPLLKLLKRKNASTAERLVAAVLEGAGKPVGGDAEGVVRPAWVDDEKEVLRDMENGGEPAAGSKHAEPAPSVFVTLPAPEPRRP